MDFLDWQDKEDGQDDILAKDINAIANYVNKLKEEIEKIETIIPIIDEELSEKSTNPVQNKAITNVVSSFGSRLFSAEQNLTLRAVTTNNLVLDSKDEENLTAEAGKVIPIWLPTEDEPSGAPFTVYFKDTKAREMIANIPIQKIFEVTTEETIDKIVVSQDMNGNEIKLDRVFVYVTLPVALETPVNWSCYINAGNSAKECLYYFSANTTGKHFVVQAERMGDGLWFTQKFSNLSSNFYNNNLVSSYLMEDVEYTTKLDIRCPGLPAGSTITVCGRRAE